MGSVSPDSLSGSVWLQYRNYTMEKQTDYDQFMVSVLRPILSFLFAPEQTESVAHGNATGSTAVAP